MAKYYVENEKEITGSDLIEILNIKDEDICISLFEKYFFKIEPTKPPRFDVNDYFKLPTERFGTKNVVWTTIGIYLMNIHLLSRFMKYTGYINKPFNSDTIEDIESKLSKLLYDDVITTDDMADYYDRIQWLGHDKFTLIAPSVTSEVLIPSKNITKRKKELLKEHEAELDPSNPNNVIVAGNIEKELVDLAKSELRGVEGSEIFDSGAKPNIKNHYKTMNIMKGPIQSVYNGTYNINTSALYDGVSKDEYMNFGDSGVIGSASRAIKTGTGGYMSKRIEQAMSSITAGPKGSDCQTPKLLDLFIHPKMKASYIGRYIVENKKLVELTNDNIGKYLNTTVKIRSPIYCIMKDPCYCNICIGNAPYSMGIKNIGLLYNRPTNIIMNKSMKKFHDMSVKTIKIEKDRLFAFD